MRLVSKSMRSKTPILSLLLLLFSSLISASPTPDPIPISQSTSTVIIQQPPSTVVIIATVTTSTQSLPDSTLTLSTTTSISPQYTNALTLKTSVLNSTNFFRYEHNAPFLLWNDSLATYAANYASKCIWAHSHGPPGENLARGYPNITASIEAWGNERSLYNFTGSQTGFTEATGHFTQLVWKSTQTVGCAVQNCNGTNGVEGFLVVCEYWPAGNIVLDTGSNPNKYFESNVQARVNNGSGFNVMSATAGATGVGTAWATTTGNAATASNTAGTVSNSASTWNDGDDIKAGLCLSLTILIVYACAFM